jgi:hypothetical protein
MRMVIGIDLSILFFIQKNGLLKISEDEGISQQQERKGKDFQKLMSYFSTNQHHFLFL